MLLNPTKNVSKQLQSYMQIRDKLTTTSDGILLRNNRIIIPSKLQAKAVDLAHEGHLGIVKTKELLREKVWFPDINRMVLEKIKNCLPCQANTKENIYQPLNSSLLPTSVWESLSADLFGPLPDGNTLLVIIDDYSRYPIVEIMKSTTAEMLIPRFDSIFSMFG